MPAGTQRDPQPISLADAQRIWNLQKQDAQLSKEDKELLKQAWKWQMWTSHGIRLQNGNSTSTADPESSGVPLSHAWINAKD
jgi:hypothetical protein